MAYLLGLEKWSQVCICDYTVLPEHLESQRRGEREEVNHIRFLPLHIKAIFASKRRLGITEEGALFILERLMCTRTSGLIEKVPIILCFYH